MTRSTTPHWPTGFGLGLGDDLGPDNPPPIDSMPGSSTSNEAQDVGTNSNGDTGGPAVNTNINPNAATTAGAQTGTSPTGTISSKPSGGGGGAPLSADDTAPNYTPWIIGGVLLAGIGGGTWWYLKKRR